MSHGQTTGDAGFATVWVLSGIAVVVATVAAVVGFGLVLLARDRAGNAADAAALSAALNAASGPPAACAHAVDLARRNGGRVTACELDGTIATVTVAFPISGPLAAFGPAVERARAGPWAAAEVGLGQVVTRASTRGLPR